MSNHPILGATFIWTFCAMSKLPQNKILIIGSGPSAAMCKDLDLSDFDVVCMNNSWAVVPNPEENIDWWHYSGDFYPRIEWHRQRGRTQMVPSPELKLLLDNKSKGWKRINIRDDGKGCYFGSERHGGFVFMDVVSLVFKTIEATDRWEEIWFLGCDHDYSATDGRTHFYGKSERVHVKDEDLLDYFYMMGRTANGLGIKINIASNNKNGLLYRGINPTNQPLTIISYYTENTPYEIEVENLRQSLCILGIDNIVSAVPNLGSWQKNTQYKPVFILDILNRTEHNLLYVDADAVVRSHPVLFDSCEYDIGVHYRNGKELLSGTIFLRNCPRTKELMRRWIKCNAENPNKWDQQNLDLSIKKSKDLKLKIQNIPPTYCQIFDSMKNCGDPVIEHFQASRRFKNKING